MADASADGETRFGFRAAMRLLILTPEFKTSGGGIATFYRDFLRCAVRLGHSVRVIEGSAFATAPDADRASVDGILTERLQGSRLLRWIDRFSHLSSAPAFRRHIAAAWAMWEQALEGPSFDVVEATDWGLLFVPPTLNASHPVIVQAHGSCGQIAGYDFLSGEETSTSLLRLVELAALQTATEVQTLSQQNAGFWEREAGRQVCMVRPAWTASHERASRPVSAAGLVVGRLQSWKGPDTLCAAQRLLGADAPVVRWIGREVNWPGIDQSASAYLARHYSEVWGSRVIHENQQQPLEIQRRQASAAFNIVPSAWDVFNFTAVEAMASRRPVIISSGAGASEMIENGVNGFLFAAGDAAALAGAIDEVKSLSSVRQTEIGNNAFETVLRELDPEVSTKRRLLQYQAALETHVKAPQPVSHWLKQTCSPPSSPVSEREFLNRLPLRLLMSHVAERLVRRSARQ